MALPKLNKPLFEIKIPSTGKTVMYTPFTVKEEKILLIAQESQESDQMILAIKQILTNCMVDVNIDNLAIFDLEYLLINLRAQSVNNMLSFKIKDPDTEEEIELEIDINEIEVKFNDAHVDKIVIDDDNYLTMKYPSTKQLKQIIELSQKKSTEKMFEMMTSCFDIVVSGEDVHKFEDYSKKEVNDFVETMSSKTIQEVKKFFETMPAMYYEKEYRNSNGDIKTFVVKGTETFFI
jgi:hypothetical protein